MSGRMVLRVKWPQQGWGRGGGHRVWEVEGLAEGYPGPVLELPI